MQWIIQNALSSLDCTTPKQSSSWSCLSLTNRFPAETSPPPFIIKLFELPNFVGLELPLAESVPDLSGIDFSSVGSLTALSGIWAVYSETNFQGTSAIIQPSSGYLNTENISWERPRSPNFIGGNSEDMGIASVKLLKGQIILYEESGFRGRAVPLTQSARSLGDFNNRAMSARIVSGMWELHQEENFQGPSFAASSGSFSPIPRLPPRTLSSVKFIPQAN